MNKKHEKLLNESVEICRNYGFNITIDEVIKRWSEPHRHWHILDHLFDMLFGIKDLLREQKINIREYNILIISAVIHDIIYDTKRHDNEERCVEYLMSIYDENLVDYDIVVSKWRLDEDIKKITEVVIGTKTHDSKDPLCKKFNKLDTWILDAQFIDMLEWENKIYKEYKWAGWKSYKKGRIKFLLGSIKGHTYNVINIKNLIDYINKKVVKIGICYYEMDKLPEISKFIEFNKRINNLFDEIIIIIVYNSNNYDKERIKEYSICSDNNDFVALSEDSFIGYINKQKGNITVIKQLEYMDKYNKNIENSLNDRVGDFRVIYV